MAGPLMLLGCDAADPGASSTLALAGVTAAVEGEGPSASGSGHLTIDEEDRTFSFNASEEEGGVSGEFNLQARQNPAGSHFKGDITKGDITCMIVIGNRAVMAGFITEAPEGSLRVGENFSFMVEDNGEGSNALPDQITFISQFPVPRPGLATDQDVLDFLCASDGSPLAELRDIEKGNV